MLIKDKIIHQSLFEIKFYKEGLFWVAYEQSAYFIWLLKKYKPIKKWIKITNSYIVQIGFPTSPIDFFTMESVKIISNQENFIGLEVSKPINKSKFEDWKKELNVYEAKIKNKFNPNIQTFEIENSIINKIKQFDIIKHSPIEAMFFLVDLKKNIEDGNL